MAETVVFQNVPGASVVYLFAADSIEVPAGAIAGDVLTVVDVGGGVLKIGADAGGGGGSSNADTLDGLDSTAFVLVSTKGAANGVAPLGPDSKIPAAYLPTIASLIGRSLTTITTPLIAGGGAGYATGSFAVAKGSVLFRVECTDLKQCRLRLYDTAAERDADVARLPSTWGGTASGLMCDLVFAAGNAYLVRLNPRALLGSSDNPPVSQLYWTVNNYTTDARAFVLNLYHTPFEV